jgi:AsmA protein
VGFKRLGLAAAAIVVLGIGAIGLPSFVISEDTARDAVVAQIKAATGIDPIVRGPVTLSLFPPDTVSVADIALVDPDTKTETISASLVTARLRLLPLLLGNLEIADLALVKPRVAITFDRNTGHSNWTPVIAHLARALDPKMKRVLSFSEIYVSDGTIQFDDQVRNVSETLTEVEMSLAWPAISRSFGATGRFVLRGEPVDASVTLGNFYATITGETSGLKFRFAGTPLKVAFDGNVSTRPTIKIDGALAADTTSLRTTLRWIGMSPVPGAGLGRFALKAQTNSVGGTVSLSGVHIELDGNAAEGVLTYTNDGRRSVKGTLAAENINLTPYISAFEPMAANMKEWNRRPLGLEGLSATDVDLRLSAAGVTIGAVKLGRTALSANLRAGRLALTVGEAQAFGGLVTGSVALAASEAGADVKSQMQFTDIDLEQSLGQAFGMRRMAGKGNLSFNLEGSGVSVNAITHTLNGVAALSASDGALTGFNIEQLLRRLERRPLSGTGDFRNGRTPFDKLALTLKVAQGVVTVEDVKLDGSTVRMSLAGTASIPAREVDLHGTATLVTATTETPGFELPFIVQGPWDEPVMLPDPQSLIRRSGAAAPLLDAVRDRRARDAVRSTIERLTGPRDPAGRAPSGP